jgi:hypothetical protein
MIYSSTDSIPRFSCLHCLWTITSSLTYASGAFGASFPFIDSAIAGVEIARKDRLANSIGLAQLLNLFRRR